MALITEKQVVLSISEREREEACRRLAQALVDAGRVTDLEGFLGDVFARESEMSTWLPGGIGIPHCRSSFVTEPSLAFGRSSEGIDWGSGDGPVGLIFMIAAPADGDSEHLKILAALARKLIHEDFTEALRTARSNEEVVELVTQAVG